MDTSSLSTIIGSSGFVVFLIIVLVCALIPFFMAKSRGRSGIGWLLLSWCIGFWWAIIILLCIGDSKEKAFKEYGLGDYDKLKNQKRLQ